METDERYQKIVRLCGDNHNIAKKFYDQGLSVEQVKERVEAGSCFSSRVGYASERKSALNAENFATRYPGLYEQMKAGPKAQGEKAVMEQFNKFLEYFEDDPAFVVETFKAGISLEAAVEKYQAKHGHPPLFEMAVEQRMSSAKCSKGEAMKFVIYNYPQLHEKYLAWLGKQRTAQTDEGVKAFDSAVEARMKEAECSKAAAIRFTVHNRPELYETYLEGLRFREEKRKEVLHSSAPVGTPNESGGFWAAVKDRMAANNCSKSDAIRFIVHNKPKLYEQFLEAQKQKVAAVA